MQAQQAGLLTPGTNAFRAQDTATRFIRLAAAGGTDRGALGVTLSAALSKSQLIRLALAATLPAPLTVQQPATTAFLANSEQHPCISNAVVSALFWQSTPIGLWAAFTCKQMELQ